MPSKTVPTPIVDKNGKPTTVHRSLPKDAPKSRVAGIVKQSAGKRTTIESPPQVPDGTLIEVGKVVGGYDDDIQAIYLNGLRVGSVEKREVSIAIGGGLRNYVSRYSKSFRWFATGQDNETNIKGVNTDIYGNGETTRLKAVSEYVLGYFENSARADVQSNFLLQGGEVFSYVGWSKEISFRGRTFKPGDEVLLLSTLGSDKHLPKNKIQYSSEQGIFDIEINGEDSRVVFHGTAYYGETIIFPLDIDNGVIGEYPDNDESFKTDRYSFYAAGKKAVNQIFGNHQFGNQG